ncbi:MAG: hypothetical protein KBG09_00320 [Syntrophobacterales bacterium]|nr:hypothetical protein [Syntrophobacterales bacterium]
MSLASQDRNDTSSRRGKNGFTRNFLFPDGEIVRNDDGVRAAMTMAEDKEGWRGIPHGGIAMGAVLALADLLRSEEPARKSPYPLVADFRLGGAGVRVGDKVSVRICPTPDGAEGIIVRTGEAFPYLSAVIGYGRDDLSRMETFGSYMPPFFADTEGEGIALPYYRNCFVCGVSRRLPGLERRFWTSGGGSSPLVMATAGFSPGDRETFYRFHTDGLLDPLPSLALLDETMGWAGFLAAASGAVTVRIGYTFYRDIRVGERLLFIGRNEKVRGSAASRLMFWTSGGAAAVDGQGRCEPVIAASAQYLGMAELTGQMRRELIPEELTTRAFRLAGLAG